MHVSASWSPPPPFSSLSSIGTLRFTFFFLLDFEEEWEGIFLKPVRSWLDLRFTAAWFRLVGASERAQHHRDTKLCAV